MFDVKRNGASVEITGIPQSIPFSVFKDIANDTGAVEAMVCYFKEKKEYDVIIKQDTENMASTVAWLVIERKEVLKKRDSLRLDAGMISMAEYTSRHGTNFTD